VSGWWVALLLAADAGTHAPPSAVQTRALPEKVQLGEPLTYELVLTHPRNERYELHPGSDLGAFELLGQSRSRNDGPSTAVTTFQVRLALFELGKKRIPDLTFDVFDDSGTWQWVAQGPEVEAVGTLPEDAQEKGEDLYDIKPNAPLAVRTYRLLWGLLVLLAAGALGYAAYRWWKRPRPVALAPPVPAEPLGVRTCKALDALRAQDLPGQRRFREFYFRLSEIVRGYLGERYAFEALECTSGELLDALRRLHTPGLPHDDFVAFVQGSDFVKFAKAEATADQCKNAIELAYRVVKQTEGPHADVR